MGFLFEPVRVRPFIKPAIYLPLKFREGILSFNLDLRYATNPASVLESGPWI
jgi:hypothetical protein